VCVLPTEQLINQVNETALAVDVSNAFAAKVRAGIFAPVARYLREDLVEDRMAGWPKASAWRSSNTSPVRPRAV
jgi:hypothetical protein